MSANNKISNLIETQVPQFVRDDHPTFVDFLEAYYEYLEQANNLVDISKNMLDYKDIDHSIDTFVEKFYDNFLKIIPDETIADRNLILKNVKDFYRARGSEKSIRFLLRTLFNLDTEFYYPKLDILRASDGKWFIEKSLKITDVEVDGTSNSSIVALNNFVNKEIIGNTSNARAYVESINTYYESGILVKELKISNQTRDFSSDETIFTTFTENGSDKSITANTFGGIIASVTIVNAGTGYSVGDNVIIESSNGTNGIIKVTAVTTGNIKAVAVLNGGAGYQNNYILSFTGGGGTGANANISSVDTSGTYHPNTYNIVNSTIILEANTAIGNTLYSNLNAAISDPANDVIANSMSYWQFSNTGPIELIYIISAGNNYTSVPTVSVAANTMIRELGILGRMEINDGGTGYAIGDKIEFLNIVGGFGTGASGNVKNVDGSGTITEVEFEEVPGFLIGGCGFSQDYLPTANVITSTGSNADISVTAILGYGATLLPVSDTQGAIQKLTIVSGGQGYDEAPTLNLTTIGDGTAIATATVLQGAFTYPGRYLNDDGHLSGYNFLQDRDYYQTFSYVVKIKESIENYRKYIKDLIHPAGLKLFGEYLTTDNSSNGNVNFVSVNTFPLIFYTATFNSAGDANGSNIEITLTSQDLANINLSYIEFIDANDMINLTNGIYTAYSNGANSFFITQANSINSTGNVYITISE